MLMTIGFILSVFVTDVMGENLIKYGEYPNGTVFYYDKDSVKRKLGIVKVWNEIRYTKKNENCDDFVNTYENTSEQESEICSE